MDEKEFDYMNVIPLVDVMLVLLTIVLTTSTFVSSGKIPVKLPSAESGAKISQTTKETIVIDRDGQTYFRSKPSNPEELPFLIKNMPVDTEFLIKADENSMLRGFVRVLDLLKKSGYSRIYLETRQQ